MTPLRLVSPPLDGARTGGTLYNQHLIAELRSSAYDVAQLGLPTTGAPVAPPGSLVLVDSLYLNALPTLADALPTAPWLLLHYLPSLVRLGRACRWQELTALEQNALCRSGGIVVPSPFMEELLLSWKPLTQPVRCIEPGCAIPTHASTDRRPKNTSRVIVVAAVREEKGILSLLEVLHRLLPEPPSWRVEVVGSLTAAPAYAQRCRSLVEGSHCLKNAVEFLGEIPQERAIELIELSQLFVSASRMESYGMALAEARSCGVPILTLAGGNAPHHAQQKWGGESFSTLAPLCSRMLELFAEEEKLTARCRLAAEHRLKRPWSAVADEFVALLRTEA